MEVVVRPAKVGSLIHLWFAFSVLLGFSVVSQQARSQTTGDIPIPEFYGIYAVADGKLLLGPKTMIAETVEVRLVTKWNTESNAFSKYPLEERNELVGPVTVDTVRIPVVPARVRILVFIQPTGLHSPMSVGEAFRLHRFRYLRNMRIQGRTWTENAWHQADIKMGHIMGHILVGEELVSEEMHFRIKPVPGQSDMALVVPVSELGPGVYRLRLTRIRGDVDVMTFAVAPLAEAEVRECIDFEFFRIDGWKWKKEFRPCRSSPPRPEGEETLPGEVSSAPPPPEPYPRLCPDYDSCLKGGSDFFKAHRWDESLAYFEEAARIEPGRGDAWVGVGGVYLEMGRYSESWSATDKGLQLGATVGARVCRERTLRPCQKGTFLLSSKQVTLIDSKGQKVFSAPPSEVTSQEALRLSFIDAAYSRLKISGKNYSLYLIPEAVRCKVNSAVECPEPGFTQQKVFANYVHHALTEIKSGAFDKPPEPPPAKVFHPVVPGGAIGEFRHGTLVTKLPSGSLVAAPTPEDVTHTHAGVDIVAECGEPVYAVAEGTVIDMIVSERDSDHRWLGYMVVVKHAEPTNGRDTYSAYFHMNEPPAVRWNESVIAGQTKVGVVGDTGKVTACHLHLEVRYFDSRFLENPEWNHPWNIYGMGDQRNSPIFLNNWENPETMGVPLY